MTSRAQVGTLLAISALAASAACSGGSSRTSASPGTNAGDGAISSAPTATPLPQYPKAPILESVPGDWVSGPVIPTQVVYNAQSHELRIVFAATPPGTFGISKASVDVSTSPVSVELLAARPRNQDGPGVTYQYVAAVPTGLSSPDIRLNGRKVRVQTE